MQKYFIEISLFFLVANGNAGIFQNMKISRVRKPQRSHVEMFYMVKSNVNTLMQTLRRKVFSFDARPYFMRPSGKKLN